jgi:hypothetical protein
MKRCPRCNRLFDDLQSFCLEDGTPLVNKSGIESDPTLVMSSRKSKMPFVFAGLVVLIVLLIGGWALLISTPEDANKNNRQPAVNVRTQAPSPTATQIETPTPSATPTAPPEANSNVSSNSETNSDSTVISKSPDEIPGSQLPVIMRAEDHLVLFALHQCRKSGSTITCDLSLTNKGEDRQFRFSTYPSRLFDELGNGYRGVDARVAKEQGGSPQIDFIKGVTTKAHMTFDKIEPNTTKITLLDLSFDIGRDNQLSIKFRNVPLAVSR